jgi:acetyl-CoA carboxylase biotin carboxyl carrier protein
VTLTARDIAEITRLLEDSSFDELRLEIDGLKLHLKRGGGTHSPVDRPGDGAREPVMPAAPDTTPATRTPDRGDAGLVDVPAPMLGTFYRAPKPGEPPFVTVGAEVEHDTIVGIIEVMKLMNTVRAGIAGTVAEIAAGDGALVEYGETLLRVRTTSPP